VDELKKKQFAWGVLLAWLPWVPVLMGVAHAFRDISETKATGLAAIAGGVAEMFVWFGIGAMPVCAVGAMALLFRSFSKGNGFRGFFTVLSIAASGLLLLLFCLFLWLLWFQHHPNF
jgi:hypothetical protein